MGSLFKPKQPPPPPAPPAPEVMGFRSEITGVERIPVKGEDGKTTIVEKQILSPEQKEAQENLSRIAQQQLERIESLSNNFDVDLIPGLSDTLKAFNENQGSALKQAFQIRTRSEENALAQFGQGDSTAAAIQRNMRERDRGLAEKQLSNESEMLKQDVRQRELSNSQNLLSIVSDRQDTQVAQLADALNRGQQGSQFMTGLLAQRNNLLYQGGLQQQQLGFQASQAGMSNLAGTIGMAALLAGPAGFGLYGKKAAETGATAAAASDRQLKHTVVKLGVVKGLPIYAFSYIGHPNTQRHIGVMAQDVQGVLPEAVTQMPNGYLAVDYGPVVQYLQGSIH